MQLDLNPRSIKHVLYHKLLIVTDLSSEYRQGIINDITHSQMISSC